jgi:ABC-type multidrug transport system fused ATPase/permease subunit
MLPQLTAGPRRPVLILLVALAFGQAGLAAAGSGALGQTMDAPSDALLPTAAIAAAFVILAGIALLGERRFAERLAQSLVHDTRRQLFETVIAQGRGTREERWLTPLVGDLAALRNWAARGVIRLWTTAVAAVCGATWIAVQSPEAALALAPLLLGLLLCLACAVRLHRSVGDQRRARGRLTRFLIRRVRAEVGGTAAAGRHGRRELDSRSRGLTCLAESRAGWAAAMEMVMMIAAGLSALTLVWLYRSDTADAAGLIASLTLLAFVGSRLVEFSRALHAHIAGRIARQRMAQLLAGNAVPE